MKRSNFILLLVLLLGLLAGCSSGQAPEKVDTKKTAAPAEKLIVPKAVPMPAPSAPLPPPPIYKSQGDYAKRGPASAMTLGGNPTTTEQPGPETPPAAKNGGGEPTWQDRWQDFLASFKDASYTFNPPSPIKVAKPYTIHLWVDTLLSHQALAEELKKAVPRDASRVESGAIQVSPVMKALLTGENFTITPNSPEQQTIHLAGRTIWSWEITPTWPGTQTLHLRLIAIPPEGISDPYTIPVPLDRTIEVKVTLWWLIDSFFDKYWQWLLGGLGTLFLTVLGWWWKKRSGEKD